MRVARILNVDIDNHIEIQTLMEERALRRLIDYEYLPGKATDYWQPFVFWNRLQQKPLRSYDKIIESIGITELLNQFQNAQEYDLEKRMEFLSRFFISINNLIPEIENKFQSASKSAKIEYSNELMILKLLIENAVDIFSGIYTIEKRNDAYYFLSNIANDTELLSGLQVNSPNYWKDIPVKRINALLKKESQLPYLSSFENPVLRAVNVESLWKDIQKNATYYHDPRERDEFRIIVFDKIFIKERDMDSLGVEVFTTETMSGHKGIGHCAFTLNLKGELSVFNHLMMQPDESNRVHAHSSMNAGDVVVSAGEMIVDNRGQIDTITDYSGHYQPQPYNIYLLLQYLKNQGMEIDHVKIMLTNNVEGLNAMSVENHKTVYNGKDFYNHFNFLEREYNTSISDIDQKTNNARQVLLRYIHNTEKNTSHPYYKLLYLKDAIFQKITNSPDYVGTTQVKNMIAKNLLYNLNSYEKNSMSESAFVHHLHQQKMLLQSFRCTNQNTLIKLIDNLSTDQPRSKMDLAN